MPRSTKVWLHVAFRDDLALAGRSRRPPGEHLATVLREAGRNPEGSRFRKIRGPSFYPLASGHFLEASLYRAQVRGSGGHRAVFAILKQQEERRRIVVAMFLSHRTRRAGFVYDFAALEARLELVVQDYLIHGLAGERFEAWQDFP